MNAISLEALSMARGLGPSAANLSRIGGQTSPEAARWAFLQWDIRERARAKFSRAEEMLFDRPGLEMASHERISAYHASRFPEGAAILEIGCGIGGDTLALARRGRVSALESDAERAELARWNLRVHDLDAEVETRSWSGPESADYVFVDPARRADGTRNLDPAEFSPRPAAVVEACLRSRLLGLKLSPMLLDGYLEGFGGGLDFVSFGHECREALVWLGSEAKIGRRAVHVESGELLESCELGQSVELPGAWVFEADPAAIRAHALGSFDLNGLGNSNGYLTGDARVDTVWLRSYEVLDHGRMDERDLKRALKKHDARTPEIKQRGTGVDPTELRKRLKSKGIRDVVVMLYLVRKSIRYVIAEPSRPRRRPD